MKKLKLLIIISLMLSVSSCSKPTIDSLFPISLLIYKKDDTYNIDMLVINNSKLTTIDNESMIDTSLYQIYSFNGQTISQASKKIKETTNNNIDLSKIKSIIMHDSMFYDIENFKEITMYILNNPSFSSNIYLYYSNDTPDKILNINSLTSSNETFNYLYSPTSIIERSFISPISITNAAKSLFDNKRMFYLPNLIIDNNHFKQENEGNLKEANIYYLAGGLFLTLNEHFKYLDYYSIKGLQWKNPKNPFELELIKDNKSINLIIEKSNWRTYIKNKEAYLDISVISTLSYNNTSFSINQIENLLQELIYKEVMDTYKQNYSDIDIYHFHDLYYRIKKDITNYDTFNLNIETNIINTNPSYHLQ